MPGIICAIRGGPSSQSTIERSIDLSLKNGQTIYFLYVVNLDFLTHSSSSRFERIKKDISQMGEFILLDAQEKAQKQQTDAEIVIADGDVVEEIIQLALEKAADYIILGTPVKENENNIFVPAKFQKTIKYITEETQAKVILSS